MPDSLGDVTDFSLIWLLSPNVPGPRPAGETLSTRSARSERTPPSLASLFVPMFYASCPDPHHDADHRHEQLANGDQTRRSPVWVPVGGSRYVSPSCAAAVSQRSSCRAANWAGPGVTDPGVLSETGFRATKYTSEL